MVGLDIDTVLGTSEWDEVRGRAVGRPDEEACERARGDGIEPLLVEMIRCRCADHLQED